MVGASGTIGSAVAAALGGPGVSIALHYCENRAAVEATQEALDRAGGRGVPIQSALDSESACQQLWTDASAAMGRIDGVAMCTGRVPWREWEALAAPDWTSALFEHCVAPFTLATLALPGMRTHGGSIVYLSSVAAKYGGSPRTIHYAAAKSALETAMRGLSREVAASGVRINGVRSGFVHSPQHQLGRSPEEIAARVAKIPMKRAGTPEEVAAAVAFLLSDKAGFVTGEVLTVAGGD